MATHPISWDWMDHHAAIQFPLGAATSRLRVFGKAVDVARNEIVQTALDLNADYILFLSDDVLPPRQVFMQLWSHHADMVTGVYWTKSNPTLPYLWTEKLDGPFLNWQVGEYFPIDLAGVDCLLVRTDVFRAIEPPWFSLDWKFGEGDFRNVMLTEDFYFYTKAKKAGFTLYCDTNVQCGHQDRESGLVWGLTEDMPFWRERYVPMENETFVADIGAGNSSPWFGDKAVVRRYDGDPNVNPDFVCDLRMIPEPPDYFDIVHSRHVLEHFWYDEHPKVMQEWVRILKPGGEMQIEVPNLMFAVDCLKRTQEDPEYDPGMYPMLQIYGQQTGDSDNEIHKWAFTQRSLESLFQFVGLEDIECKVVGDSGENLRATGKKPSVSREPFVLLKEWDALAGRKLLAEEPEPTNGAVPETETSELVEIGG